MQDKVVGGVEGQKTRIKEQKKVTGVNKNHFFD